MLGRVMPVQLPFDASEDKLIVARQNKLARDIDTINRQIRNNVLSASEGASRIRFKSAEINQLQRYRSSKRVDTGRLSPPPRTNKPIRSNTGPSKKYRPTDDDKVPSGTKPSDSFWDTKIPTWKRSPPESRVAPSAEDDRAGMTSKKNQRPSGNKPPQTNRDPSLNKRGLREADYYVRFTTNYKNQFDRQPSEAQRKGMKQNAYAFWNNNRSLPTLIKPQKKSVVDEAKEKASGFLDKLTSKKSTTKAPKTTSQAAPKTAAKPKLTVKDNPHGESYGTKVSLTEASWAVGRKTIKYGGKFYGPKPKRGKKFGVSYAVADPSNAINWNNWNKANNIAGFAGMPNSLVAQRAKINRETALMRKRAGARIRFDNPRMTNATQMRSWETYGRREEVEAIKAFVPMLIGLEKFPELTPEGNAMMVEFMQTGGDPNKMNTVANKLASDLVNKSGYFVKQYNVEVDPLQRKVKVSEMSGFAGGLTKTRNSMQRLLK